MYRATMQSSGGVESEVAIKVLRADIDPGSDSVKRLRDEGRLLGKLSHPSIVKVHDLVLLDARVSLVTEYIEGEDLDQTWQGNNRMSARALVMAVGEVASALHAAWASPSPISGEPLRLIHRDVKPANIRIGKHGEVKLLDFGIARAGNAAREAQTAANAMMGSYLYMAPERFHEDAIQPPSDIFALGSVMYEGLAGERFFGGMSLQQVYAFMLSSNRLIRRLDERLAELAIDAPEPALALVREMMSPEPTERPTAAEIADRCEDLAEELSGPTLKRWCREREWPEPPDIQGSLDGRVLTAGAVGTMDPPPYRGQVPVPTSGRDPNAPPAPGDTGPHYSPPGPTAMPSPRPQALGSPSPGSGSGSQQHTQPPQSGPALGNSQGNPMGGPSLGGPSLGDLSQARSDAGRDEPAFVLGDTPLPAPERRAESRGGRGVLTMVVGGGLLLLVVAGLLGVVGFFVASQQGLLDGDPIADVADPEPIEDAGDGLAEADEGAAAGEGDEQPAEDVEEPAPDGAADEEGTEEADPAPVEVAPVDPAPAPTGPTASSLTSKGWNAMSDPGAALDLFRQAMDIDSDYGEAYYGAGYAQIQLGQKVEATTNLCRGRALVDSRTANEIDRILEQNELSCP